MTEIQIIYDGPVVNKSDAIRQGLKFFFTGVPCRNGHVDQRRVDNHTCETCSAVRNKRDAWKKVRYALENPDKVKDSKRRWEERNRESLNQKSRDRRALYPEKKKLENSIWWKANRDKARVYSSKRRRLMEKAGGSFSESDIKEMMARQKGKCAEPSCRCDVRHKYHIDHIMPVKLGGDNNPSNLQILCPRCNSRKSAKHPLDWAAENGRLC